MAALTGLDDTPTYTENGGLTVLDDDATLDGAATYNGATLTLRGMAGPIRTTCSTASVRCRCRTVSAAPGNRRSEQ